MAEFTMQQLEALAGVERGDSDGGQGRGHDTSHYRSGVATFHPPPAPRDVRRAIYSAVYSAGGAVSRAEIAKALGVKKTPWLCQHIERLVDERFLTRIDSYAPNGATMYYYGIATLDDGQR